MKEIEETSNIENKIITPCALHFNEVTHEKEEYYQDNDKG